MSAKPLSLVHRTRPPRQAEAGPAPLLLLLHGVGSNEEDLLGLAPALDPRFFVVSARAPYTLEPGAYAWFHVGFTPSGPVIAPDEAEQSRLTLLRFIAELIAAYPVDPDRVYLMGFSQGAIMAQSAALTRPDTLAGIVAMSGRILPEVLPHRVPREALTGLPVLVVHGTADPVLPVRHGREAREQWRAVPVALTYREYPMAHQVSPESLHDIAAWLRARITEPRRLAPGETT